MLYFPVFFYYIWLIIKHRSCFFFTASNPSIDFGGMIGEKKSEIFDLIPDEFMPKTLLVERGDLERAALEAEKMGFPLIAKPDVGERGTWVNKIHNQQELKRYVEACPVNFLLQEMVDLPIELGVFYVKYPGKEGRVTSIVRKDFLSVVGDGESTVNSLLEKNTRAFMTADLESEYLKQIGSNVPEKRRASTYRTHRQSLPRHKILERQS